MKTMALQSVAKVLAPKMKTPVALLALLKTESAPSPTTKKKQ
jgi:hypothetical protein